MAVDTALFAAPPVEEIRAIMAERVLWPPPSRAVATLGANRLNEDMRAIDPYARYVPPPPSPGRPFFSLGIELFAYQSRLWVRPDPGGPADRAGVPEIGQLEAVDGIAVGHDLMAASGMLEAAMQQDRVALTLAVSGAPAEIFLVRPSPSPPESFTWHEITGTTVVRIREFIAHTTGPGLLSLYGTVIKPRSRVVVDLRGCSGGDLYEAIEIAGLFVPAGLPLLSTCNREGLVRWYKAPPGVKIPRPSLLLVDRRTASAAEILAGILQHHGLSVLIGERSAGKCVSQTLFPLSDGGGLYVTTHAIRFPDQRSCTGAGVDPDVLYPGVGVEKVVDILKKCSKSKAED